MSSRQSVRASEEAFPFRAEVVVPRPDDVRRHVQTIMDSQEFKRSRRSSEFLQYLVNKKLGGESDELKERIIGVQLFGRDPAYDTGGDAIVRVTATDVRRRLKRFYESTETDIRVELSPGSYVISFKDAAALETIETPKPSAVEPPIDKIQPIDRPTRPNDFYRSLALIAAFIVLTLSSSIYYRHRQAARTNRLPWSAMVPHQGKLKIIFSDPDIVALQSIAGSRISLADYAEHHYLPAQQATAQPSLRRLFHGNNVPINDTRFALGIESLLASSPIETYSARVIEPQNFATEDNFILLGSPLSNPWVGLFQDHLDFYFQYDPVRNEEIIYNRHVGRDEMAIYAPTLPGWGTGQSYAIIGLFPNPNQTGRILILAGSNAAATDAAGRLVTDAESITQVLQAHGIDVHDPRARFELLLRVNTMASSLRTYDVVACHPLS